MRNTVFGILCDELGHASDTFLAQGHDRPELRVRAWASPASEVRDVQAERIPVDRDHDGYEVGEVVYLERDRAGSLWCVAHVAERVVPAVRVRVADQDAVVETPLYWSAERLATPDFRDVLIRSVALTASPARVAAKPLTFLRGALDHREAPRRWRLEGFQRELLERAAVAHLDRRREGGPLYVREHRRAPVTERMRSGLFVDGELVGSTDYGRPPGKLRWHPSTVVAVR